MESAVRYDFSFPPKSSNTNVMLQQQHQPQQNLHNVQQRQHQHDSSKFNGYPGTNVGLPKSASTSLLTCASNCKLNNNNLSKCCANCAAASSKDQTTITLNNNNMHQNNLNMKHTAHGMVSNKHHSVIKPSALGLLQHSSNSQQMHHGAIVNSINQSIGNTPHTPKDSNCSFSKNIHSHIYFRATSQDLRTLAHNSWVLS